MYCTPIPAGHLAEQAHGVSGYSHWSEEPTNIMCGLWSSAEDGPALPVLGPGTMVSTFGRPLNAAAQATV
jgi:hypothetical protein